MSKKKVGILLIAVGAAVCLGLVYMVSIQNANPRTANLTKVESYRHIEPGQVACTALLPECGLCPGEVINKECYVDKTKLTPQELHQMGL